MPTPCPPDDVLGALVQQELPDDESERVRVHIDECATCAQAVVAVVRGGAIDPAAAPTLALGKTERVARGTLPPIGAKIGRYDLRELLGAGGMGHVYQAYDAELDRAIALKVLRPDLAVAQSLTERLVRESRLMAKVSHPAVITVYDVGQTGATVFIAMELIRGETLGAYLARTKKPWREIVQLFERAGAGLAAAHRAGIVHRDFKPDNVLVELDPAGRSESSPLHHGAGTPSRVVVTDFGIARATSIAEDPEQGISGRRSDPRLTVAGATVGTPAYMAPEQLAGDRVDARADIFAFAVSLWEALFGVRAFPGNTVEEIRHSMRRLPQAKPGVPRALVRAVQRGLALDPAERWQDMTAFVRELRILRARRRRVQLAAGVMTLVAAAIAGAFVLARSATDDACARAELRLDVAAVRGAIADPAARDAAVSTLESAVQAWRHTHAATCNAERHPIQPPTTAACLDARKLEITGIAEDLVVDHGVLAQRYVALIGDPAACATPAPNHLIAKLPSEPALRRKVAALRYRIYAAEAARDRDDYKTAIADATKLVAEADATWPFVHAEALYLLGTTHAIGGSSKQAIEILRQASAVAETAHNDMIAAGAWTQLIISAAFDEDAPERGLEYAIYADAALARLGYPPAVTSRFEYAKGSTLSALARFAEAEKSLRHAVELAQTHHLDTLPQATQGLGFLFERQGRYAEAVDAYRTAMAGLDETAPGNTSSAIVFRERLAINLAMLGRSNEAEAVSRQAVAIAEAKLPAENVDRAIAHGNLAEVLQQADKLDEALVEIRRAMKGIAAIENDRSGRYGELLQIEADLLHLLGSHDESAAHFTRACDIAAFHNGDGSAEHAVCELSQAMALTDAGHNKPALQVIEKAAPVLLASYGEPHPQTANALLTRGVLRIDAGNVTEGIADIERAIGNFAKVTADAGHLANAQWVLARALWSRDRGRAKATLEEALANFDKASLNWVVQHAEAAEWLASNGKPKQR